MYVTTTNNLPAGKVIQASALPISASKVTRVYSSGGSSINIALIVDELTKKLISDAALKGCNAIIGLSVSHSCWYGNGDSKGSRVSVIVTGTPVALIDG